MVLVFKEIFGSNFTRFLFTCNKRIHRVGIGFGAYMVNIEAGFDKGRNRGGVDGYKVLFGSDEGIPTLH